jgi:hypothetical protein
MSKNASVYIELKDGLELTTDEFEIAMLFNQLNNKEYDFIFIGGYAVPKKDIRFISKAKN